MRWSYRIARIAGTDIKIHATFLLLLLYVFTAYGQGGWVAAYTRAAFIVVVFVCVLLHEFGHILMAKHYGVRTPDVILLPIGGVARLEKIPEEPRQEFLIALAGPAVTLAIAAAGYLWLAQEGTLPSLRELLHAEGSFAFEITRLNALLLAFNLLPAFPMDGGRVLRAILATRMGYVRATRIAATIGQALAIGLGMIGLRGEPMLVLIAFFVFLGAGAEAAAVETRSAGRGVQVEQMMITRFRSIPVHAALQDAVKLLLEGEQREFPVVDNLGRVEGLLSRENLIRGLSERGAASSVGESMTANVQLLVPHLDFDTALAKLRQSGLRALPVVNAAGQLVGLLTMDNISDLLLVRRAQEGAARRET